MYGSEMKWGMVNIMELFIFIFYLSMFERVMFELLLLFLQYGNYFY
jgi:hypothetical protein